MKAQMKRDFFQKYGVDPTGLVLWLDQSDPRSYGDSQNWLDLSGLANTIEQTTGANQPDIVGAQELAGSCRGFNGATDFMAQKIYDDESGATFWPTNAGACFNANNARFRVAGVDLSAFASVANTHMLVVHDSSDKTAFGYMDVADSAEALGGELFIDGAFSITSKGATKVVAGITKADPGVVTFAAAHGFVDGTIVYFSSLDGMTELNTQYWKLRSNVGDTFELSDTGIATWDSSSLDTSGYGAIEDSGNGRAQAVTFTNWVADAGWNPDVDGAGTLTGKAACDGTQGGNTDLIVAVVNITAGKSYKITATVVVIAGTIEAQYRSGAQKVGSSGSYIDYGIAAVTYVEWRGTSTFIGTIDDASVKELTHVGEDGVLIMSTKGGATQSWAYQETDIDLNDIDSFEVLKTDFQILTALSVFMWVKPDDGQSGSVEVFISKQKEINGYRSWRFRNHAAGKMQVFVSSDGGGNSETELTDAAFFANGQETWHHIGFVYNGTTNEIVIYGDGVALDSTTDVGIPASLYDTSEKLTIGALSTPTDHFAGPIGPVIVFERAVSTAEKQRIYIADAPQFGGL